MPVLYHLTLQKPTAIVNAVHGNFSAPRAQEVVVSHGRILELLRPDEEGKVHSVCTTDVFGIIRSVAAFRLTGAMKDYIVLGSDSGRLVIVEFNAKKNCFERVHCETYGKTGVRRVVAGEYVAVDPRGRALMVAALERQKFVYILNRDSKAALTISSPLEAHKSHVLCADLCGVDVGFENPLFATLEQPYPQTGKAVEQQYCDSMLEEEEGGVCKPLYLPPSFLQDSIYLSPRTKVPGRVLCFWEMDLGLNHVVKKASLPVPSSAHCLIPVPGGGGNDGPSGVLVCCENVILYKKIDHEEVACAIPRRLEMGSDRGLVVVSFAVHKMKGFFFVLLQSEFGDIYKVEVTHEEGVVRELTCRYFDTVPVANALCVLKSGYLFVAAEFGNHQLYQFTGIGTDESDPRCASSHPLGPDAVIAFKPRALKNLALADELPSLSPVTDMHVLDAQGTGTPQLYLLCGRGSRSTLRVLQHGLAVEELADNELPGRPRAVWTLKESNESLYDAYILVSFEGSSLVLQIGETVEEVADSQFVTNATTLHASLLANDSFVQVLETEVRHMQSGGGGVSVWRPPGGRRIKVASANERQLALGLSGGDVVLFELDETGALSEVAKKALHVETTCLRLQPVPPGRTRASFMAAGGLDNVVRVLSVEKDKQLKQVATQLLPSDATPESVCLAALQSQNAGEYATYLYVRSRTRRICHPQRMQGGAPSLSSEGRKEGGKREGKKEGRKERGKEGKREGRKEEGKERGRERGKEGKRKGKKERGRERGKEGKRERGKEGKRDARIHRGG
ncbi:splicing factor 3b subunit 3 [Cyclospora cayetanensis]|uniref:Splicing factor 3b subunit 3 n=1 Tax=Cyclospora cayetanensis TaxID=88456 RepID=A0A1D3D924_9EIME|nr:splicing factor 3b subunit 3 [Cyclospora cayetanensis]